MKRFQSFRLDTANQCLWGEEARVEITPKAFGVLSYLVEHAGRLVTHDELLEALWPGTYINPEVLRKYVLEIRRALGDRPDKPVFIETRPKRGYQFVASVIDDSAPETFPAEGTKKIVGREPALAELGAYLSRAQLRERQIVFITGEAGIGKTALADEFQRRAQVNAPGVRIVCGECIESHDAKEAYYPILEALGQLCRGPAGDSVVQILAAEAPTWLIQFPGFVKRGQREMLQREIVGATHARMQREICQAMEAIASESPLLLVLEDLQWVDPSTVDFISALARRRQPAKLMLIGMYRPVDVVLSDRPLKALKQDLLIHHLCHEVALQPLEEADVAEYLAAESGGAAVPEGLAQLIHRRTEGNPLFILEVLEHMRAQKLITKEDGGLRLTLPLREIQLHAPESLRQMIEAWIERLSHEERRALEVASVIGTVFSTAVGATAADMHVEKFEDLCEGLSRRAERVRWADPQEFPDGTVSSRYEFVHDLYRDVLYRRQSPAKRKKIHLRVGELLEALYAPRLGEVATELAYHFEQGGDWLRTIKYLQLAADTEARRFEPKQAAGILEHALGLVNKIPEAERAQSEIEALQKLAVIYVNSWDPRAVQTYEALAGRAAHYSLAEVEVRALLDMGFPLIIFAGVDRYMEALGRARDAISRFGEGDALTRAAWCFLLGHQVYGGKWDPGDLAEAKSLVAKVREAGDRRLLGEVQQGISYGLVTSSKYREAHLSAEEGFAIAVEGYEENPFLKWNFQSYSNLVGWCHTFLGEWSKALRKFDKWIEMAEKNDDRLSAMTASAARCRLLIEVMDFAGAQQSLESGLAVVAPRGIRRLCLVLAGWAEAGLGNHERALEHLLTCRNEMDQHPMMNDWYYRMPLQRALTDAWLSKGDLAQARVEAKQFLQVTLATEERMFRAQAFEVNARVAIAEQDFDRAQDSIAQALKTMVGYEVPLAHWRVHATAAELYQNSGDWDLAERHLALSRETIMKLANSLPAEEPLRQKFLSAPMVRNILGDADL